MSRAQGDFYRTHTNIELNAYRLELNEKLRKMENRTEKWYRAGRGWICTEDYNNLYNPNGDWKWNGWVIDGHTYIIRVFPEECVEIKNGKPHVIGWSQVVKSIDDDKDAANKYFNTVARELAKNLINWMPSEIDNAPAFGDYEGRKPLAGITLNWYGDTYYYELIVDGNTVLTSLNKEECVAEANRLGAELQETHTP